MMKNKILTGLAAIVMVAFMTGCGKSQKTQDESDSLQVDSASVSIQNIELLLKGGHLIDPRNNIDAPLDVAIVQGKIFQVAHDIPANTAKMVVDVTGLYITPGLIDIHTHVFVGSRAAKFADGTNSVTPDDFAPRAGITTVVDAGTSGWRNFYAFKKQVVDVSKTRVLAWLNIFGVGFSTTPEEGDPNDIDLKMNADTLKKYSDIIVGIEIGHYRGGDWAIFEKAASFAKTLDLPLIVECHLSKMTMDGMLNRMRPGDIMTHCFGTSEGRNVIDENGHILPYILEAEARGILYDVGHGGGAFSFSQAIPAVEAQFYPNSFGTDMHHNSVNRGMKDMLNIMSKFLNMGMSLQDIILRATWRSASSIKREDLGHLSVGAVADIAVLNIRDGNFGFVDARGFKIDGTRKFEAEMTIREGLVVWDLNGLSAIDYNSSVDIASTNKNINR